MANDLRWRWHRRGLLGIGARAEFGQGDGRVRRPRQTVVSTQGRRIEVIRA